MIIFALWLAFAVVVGVFAAARNRSFAGWALLSLLVSPLLGGLFLLLAGDKPAPVRPIERGPDPLAAMTRLSETSPSAGEFLFELPEPPTTSKAAHVFWTIFGVSVGLAVAGFAIYRVADMGYRAAHPAPLEMTRETESMRSPLIVVPEPDPASLGIILNAQATARAPLVPLY